MGRKKIIDEPPVDSTAWLLNSGLAEVVLMHTHEIKFMFMLGYTYLHGCKLFPKLDPNSSLSYKLVSMILQCTGGGTLVPIFLNGIPVSLAQDSYPIAIIVAFLLHQYLPILRDVLSLSPILKVAVIFMYETLRASVVVKLTTAAAKVIPASDFAIPLFGPIFCGAIAGCGGAFLPLNKGLDPIKANGLGQPMLSAFIGATFYHLFTQTSLSEGVINAPQKAQVIVALFFVAYHLFEVVGELLPMTKGKSASAKNESKKTK
jgi:hypothetical protein